MPLLSDTMTEGKIVAWNKKVGDKVKSDDVLADVETDKATMEVVGYAEGTLLYVGVPAGEAAKINQIIAIVGKEGEDYKSLLDEDASSEKEHTPKESSEEKSAPKAETSPAPAPSSSNKVALPQGAKEIRMPLLSDTMTEGKIVSWNKKVGDKVNSDDVLAEVETDKATMEVVGYEEGTLLYVGVPAGQAAKINQIIAIVGKEGTDLTAFLEAEKNGANAQSASSTVKEEQAPEEKQTNEEQSANNEHQSSSDGRIKASPLARKLAQEKGLDISQVHGSGDGGRVVRKDIESFKPAEKTATEQAAPNAAQAVAQPAQPAVAAFTENGKESFTDVPLTQMRKTIARRLGESKFSAPHFYLTMSINMDNAMQARVAMNEVSPVKISFNDMVIKACAMALKKHPDVNSSWMGDFIRKNNHVHIGSALALPEGLMVPVIRFADQKSLSQIAYEAKELYQKAKDKKIQPADFTGNTFTISNLGMMDIDEFTAIINPPDSCILAVGRIKEEVVKKEDGFGVTNMMKVTLSCDHRSVDGAVGAAFLQTLKKFLENPVTMMV